MKDASGTGDVVRHRIEALIEGEHHSDVLGGRPRPGSPRPPGLGDDLPQAGEATRNHPPAEDGPDHPDRASAGKDRVRAGLRLVWGMGREHVVAVLIVVLVGVAWAMVSMTKASSTPLAAPSASPSKAVSGTLATPSPTPQPSVLVHVMGAVAHPGVVTLTPGARVQQALDAAGGVTTGARPGELNLAAPVADGAQIVIGTAESPGGRIRDASGAEGATAMPVSGTKPAGGSSGPAAAQVDLNAATEAQLDTLPGVGPVTAGKIIEWRTQHGRFTKVEELQEVDGIGPKSYAQLAPKVRV